jgi:hypothetical protein
MAATVCLSDNRDKVIEEISQQLVSPYVLFIIFGNEPDADELLGRAEHYGVAVEGWRALRILGEEASSVVKLFLQKKPDPHQLLRAVDLSEVVAIITSVDDEIRAVLKKPYLDITNGMVRGAWYAGERL